MKTAKVNLAGATLWLFDSETGCDLVGFKSNDKKLIQKIQKWCLDNGYTLANQIDNGRIIL